jgi:hypothetical protein
MVRYDKISGVRRILALQKRLTTRSYQLVCLYTLAIGSFIIIITNSVPWVPSEIITTTAKPPFTGFVLNESDSDITILTLNKRQVIHISSAKVVGQTVCRERGVTYKGLQVETVLAFLTQNIQQRYPDCI